MPPTPSSSASPAQTVPVWVLGLLLVGLAILVAWVHRGGLEVGFVFDDRPRIVEVEKSIAQIWPLSGWLEGTQRPVVRFTLVLNHVFGGLEPRGYHAFNIAVMAAASVMVVLLVRAAGDGLRSRGLVRLDGWTLLCVAFAVALVWSCHPVQTATTTYVIQRAESLMGLFALLAAWASIRGGRSTRPMRWRVLVVAATALAVGAKPVAVTLPATLFALDACVIAGGWRAAWRSRGGLHAVNAAVVVAILAVTGVFGALFDDSNGIRGAGAGVADTGPLDYAVSQLRALGLYAGVLVDPTLMSIDHGPEALAPSWTRAVGVLVVLVTVAVLALGSSRRAWWTILPISMVLVLLPTTSVVPLADPAADHRLHLALLPVVIGIVGGVAFLLGRLPKQPPIARLSAAVVAAGALAAVTTAEIRGVAARNRDYRDPTRLWSDVVARRPDHVRGLVNRAGVSIEQGRYDDAARDLAVAYDLQPGNPVLLVNLALVDLEAGRLESAVERLRTARRARPDDPVLHLGLGDAYRGLGRAEEAVASYRTAIEILPSDGAARVALGNALSDLERLDEAAVAFADAAALARDRGLVASARYNEGNMRFRLGDFDRAIEAYEAALRADPEHARAGRWLEEARAVRDG